jgi:hypothetical protein
MYDKSNNVGGAHGYNMWQGHSRTCAEMTLPLVLS